MEKDKPDAHSLARSSKLEARRGRAKGRSLREEDFSVWFDPRNKPWLKVIACVVIAAFLHQDIVWAAGKTYPDDLKLMFEQPKEIIERLGSLFSIKEAYAFDSEVDFFGVDNGNKTQIYAPGVVEVLRNRRELPKVDLSNQRDQQLLTPYLNRATWSNNNLRQQSLGNGGNWGTGPSVPLWYQQGREQVTTGSPL
ncbi:MAG: hypothetical protein JW714_01150, partial [Candidatus Omnitrophica bacterium]|nr:hypothetical protein [Candidatus Omnitrophota bacterium]